MVWELVVLEVILYYEKEAFNNFSICVILLFVIRPVLRVHAAENTTIIALDPNKDYQKGEVVKVTVGISSTDGSYLKSADCGFGYNGATMKLLTETESVDHFM